MTKRYLVLSLATLIMAACGGGEVNKTEKLQKLKQDKAKLDLEISTLEKELKAGDSSVKTKTVTIAAIQDTLFEHFIDIQGNVDARENVNVGAQSPGIIKAIYVKEGQHVSKGQTLAQVDDQLVRSNIAELQTRLDLARTLYLKQENLWKQKIGSEVQYLNAKSGVESLERNLETLKEQQALARIISPINGTVDAVIAKIGDAAAPGQPAFRVVNSSNLRVVANIAESFAGRVKTGDEVIVTLPDIQKEIRTRIGFASKVIDPLSRTINVEIPLKPSNDLHPNMIAQLRIVDYRAKDAIVIPVGVIQYSLGKPYVLTVKGEGNKLQAVRTNIELGRTYNDKAEVKSGLKSGDRVITTGFQGLNDNDYIKL
ncbi:efflux RND transporter periplasmic adaptor subunit [Chitinophaga barathri]|uniref:Efflux RND transporter periplasmic adaptor subunit n=1 Tax=Chitinophaga barathri TaxID=1647451 RepID=A0A3N4MA54_9BACT|nr:efflux RND transporter periplasmic adaptor subunit [Chitinophaga barathri]RPD40632.1 efflux RND transporter periplasmic adaptor subunit [Chitinophaga barathri]